MTDCIFCKIIAGEIPATKVYENEHVLAFDDLNAQAPCHVLVIPKVHVATCNEMLPEHSEHLGALFLGAKEVARVKGVDESGYRLVMNAGAGAGQSVFHLHLHVLGGREFSWPPG